MKTIVSWLFAAALLAVGMSPARAVTTAHAAYLSPGLQAKLAALTSADDSVGTVIITFNTTGGLAGVTGLDALLTRVGLTAGHEFDSLGIISALATKGQVALLASAPQVRSVSDNYRLYYNLHQARVLCGVDKLRADASMTARNHGQIIDGTAATQFSVALIDSGIDTTNTDLPFDITTSTAGTVPTTGKVIQNVQVVGDDAAATVTYSENQANTDSVGHGTHCAGIIGGTGAYSRTTAATAGPGTGTKEDFSGVAGRFLGTSTANITNMATASGVKIVGLGSGAGLFVLDALGGFEYAIDNQTKYNIKLTSNSYGSSGVYTPDDPLVAAIATAYQHGIASVFAAGNSGPGSDTISSFSKSPYVICVAAGTKEGGLASFSSRGLPANQRTGTAKDAEGNTYNPNLFNLPAITAPGTGREFVFDAPYDPAQADTAPFVAGVSSPNPDTVGKKFYSDIISTRSKSGSAADGTNDQEFPVPYQTNYTMISGTSMATPFVSGTCALLLSVNPALTPANLKKILQSTATHLPDYQDYQAGAGYLNVYAAVDLALSSSGGDNFVAGKPYKPFNRIDQPYAASYPAFITTINNAPLAAPGRPTGYPPTSVTTGTGGALDEDFSVKYSPSHKAAATYAAAKTNAATNANAYAFLVDANANGTPNTSLPATKLTQALDVRIQFGQGLIASQAGGNTIGMYLWAPDGTFYSSGIALPIEDDPNREVVVNHPIPGLWVAEFRGIRGLAAVPVTPPTGAGLPDTVTGQIYRTNSTVTNPPTDIAGLPQTAAITTALLNRYFDQVASHSFQPAALVTRSVFLQVLADNVPLRQSLASNGSAYSDLAGATARAAEAAAQLGSTLRDWDFLPAPVMTTVGTTFSPDVHVSRFTAATALVRALGLDPEARHLAGTAVKVAYQGSLIPVTDGGALSDAQKGYLQLAVNRGLIDFVPVYNATSKTYSATVAPTRAISRAELAAALVNFRTLFPLGNSLAPTELAPQGN